MGFELRGASVLVTGATGGLGRAIARELAGRGARLVLTGRQERALADLAGELGSEAQALAGDLANPEGLGKVVSGAGEIDVLVANAGLEAAEPLDDLSADEIRETVEVNLIVPALLAQAFLPSMIDRGQGHLVFMSSLAGKVATSGNGPLCTATKWGLRGLGLGLRLDLRGTGVGVSTVFPGPVRDAGMFASTEVSLPRGVGTSSPEDVARAVAKAIIDGKPEVEVAAMAMKLGARVGAVAPRLAGDLSHRAGAGDVRRRIIAARRTT